MTERMRNTTQCPVIQFDLTNSDTAGDDHQADEKYFERKMTEWSWSLTTTAAGTRVEQVVLEKPQPGSESEAETAFLLITKQLRFILF